MAGEGWQQRPKKRRANLADWCNTNLSPKFAAKVAGLVANKEAAPRLLRILQTLRELNGPVLDKVQRLVLEAQVKGAGPWSAASPADRSAAPRLARRSTAPGSAVDPSRSFASVAAGPVAALQAENAALRAKLKAGGSSLPAATTGDAVTGGARRRGRSSGRRLRSAATGATRAATQAVPMEAEQAEGDVKDESDAQWKCLDCGKLHLERDKFLRQCPLCAWGRVRAPTMAAEQAAGPAVDGVDELAILQQELDVLQKLKLTPGLGGCISGLKAKIEKLTKAAVPPPVPDQAEQLRDALRAEADAEARIKTLSGKLTAMGEKIAQWSADREALTRSLDNAKLKHQQTLAVTETVRLAVGLPPAVAHAAPAHASLIEALRHTMEVQLRTQGGVGDGVQAEMLEVAQVNFESLSERLRVMFNMAQVPRAATGAAAPATPKMPAAGATTATPAAGAVGGALLKPRVPLQVESMAKPSAAQAAKLAHSGALRGVEREAAFAAGRRDPEPSEAESKAAGEAEDADDISGYESPP